MVKNLVNYLTYIPKKLIALFAILALVFAPLHGVFADQVSIEAAMYVANSTAGESYQKSTNAMVDDIVKFEIWYHNKEEANSGKVAENLTVKANLPTQKGKTQNVTSTVSASNSNTVTNSTTVNLSLDDAYLEFIPGSVYWRHNAGTNENPNWVTQQISDSVVTGAGGAVIENAQPCFNFEATVTFLARVKAQKMSITKQVRKTGEKNWTTENAAKVGEELEYLITVRNESNTELKNVIVGDNMPGPMQYVVGSTMIKNSNHPNGDKVNSDNITTGGINIGHYGPGSAAYVWFKVKVTDQKLNCGANKLTNVAVTTSEGFEGELYNTAITSVDKQCQPPTNPPTTPPTTPGELPNTGIEGPLAGLLGSGGLGVAIRSYIRTRRGLASALLDA